jgi:hypothetical protein
MKKKKDNPPPLFAGALPELSDVGPFPYGKPGAPDEKTVACAPETTPGGPAVAPVHTSER